MAKAIQLLITTTTVFRQPNVLIFLAFLTAATVAIGWCRTALFAGITRIAFIRYWRWEAVYGLVGRRVLS